VKCAAAWALAGFCVLGPQAGLFAAFLDNGATARTAALGGSYVAVADDAAALTMNPAGLSLLARPETVADYNRPYAGLTDGSVISQFYLGSAVPLSIGGAVAVGWKELSFAGLYKERTLSVGYGRWLTSRLAAGFCIKQLHHSFNAAQENVDDFGNVQAGTPDFFAQNGTSQNAYSADLGLLLKLSRRARLGVSAQDVNEPNIALSPDDRDLVARTLRAGLAAESESGLTTALGLETRKALADARDWVGSVGIERWFKETASGQFGLRGSAAAGSRQTRMLETGAGVRINGLELDYAFALNMSGITVGDTYGTHRFSIAYRFGQAPPSVHPSNLSSTALESDLALLLGEEARASSPLSLTGVPQRRFPRNVDLTFLASSSDAGTPMDMQITVLYAEEEPQLASNRLGTSAATY